MNDFEQEQEIGRGGAGVVHVVVDRALGRRVARKTLHESVAPDSTLGRLFVDEARITGQLDHPNVVPVHGLHAGGPGIAPSFTMKLVHGKTLARLLDELGPARLAERHLERLLQVLLKVCDALSFAHARGVVHRDLKPQNIMVGSHGQVYVMDWGLALVRRPGELHACDRDRIVGTPGYMAPEQAWLAVDDIDARTDVYALGGCLYRILTGWAPHEGADAVEAVRFARQGTVRPPEERNRDGDLPPELCRIAMRALARRPVDRYPSVDALRSELEVVLRGGGWFASQSRPAGAIIIAEGDAADAAYVIVRGRCEAFKTIDGREVVLRRMGPGEVFGETAVLTARPRTASVRAVDDVELKVVTGQSLERELERNGWMKALVHALAERFREADEKLSLAR